MSDDRHGQTSQTRSREILDSALPLLLLVLLLLLGFTTVQPFLPAILWGVFLSVSLRPVHERFVRALGGRRAAASLGMGLLLTVVLVLPIFGLSRSLISFIPEALVWFSEEGVPLIAPEDEPIQVDRNLFTGEIRSLWETVLRDLQFIRDHFGEELRPAAFWLIREGRLVGVFVAEFALGVLLATLLLHRAEPLSRASFTMLERVGGSFATGLGLKAVLTIRSTVLGLLGSATAQTAVASFAYYLSGVPHWPILALLTFMLGLIQIGPILIWLPIAFWLWSNGELGMAVFMVLWGLIVVGLTDNVIKSLVVARGANIPAILAFFGAVGGLLTWGVVGIFLGPVILAVCYQLALRWLDPEARDVAEDESLLDERPSRQETKDH
jgi:predicted PurR-regulated permease PerM